MAKRKFNISTRIVDHLIQAFLIFASVFLAFWMNENRISNNLAQNTSQAKSTIINKIQSRQIALKKRLTQAINKLEKTN